MQRKCSIEPRCTFTVAAFLRNFPVPTDMESNFFSKSSTLRPVFFFFNLTCKHVNLLGRIPPSGWGRPWEFMQHTHTHVSHIPLDVWAGNPSGCCQPLHGGAWALWNVLCAFLCQTAVCFGTGDDMNLSPAHPHAKPVLRLLRGAFHLLRGQDLILSGLREGSKERGWGRGDNFFHIRCTSVYSYCTNNLLFSFWHIYVLKVEDKSLTSEDKSLFQLHWREKSPFKNSGCETYGSRAKSSPPGHGGQTQFKASADFAIIGRLWSSGRKSDQIMWELRK